MGINDYIRYSVSYTMLVEDYLISIFNPPAGSEMMVRKGSAKTVGELYFDLPKDASKNMDNIVVMFYKRNSDEDRALIDFTLYK